MSRVVNKFREICTCYKDKPAFIYAKKDVLTEKTFAELEREVASVAAYLTQRGVRYGDKILAFATPSYDLCVFMLASMSIGASLMYVDFWAKQDRLKKAFEQYRPDFMFVSKTTAMVRFFLKEINTIKNIIRIDENRSGYPTVSYNDHDFDISEDAVALLTLTTGSTGKPKVAIRSHGQLHEQLMLVCNNMDVQNKDEYVLTTSYMYVFSNLLNGFTTVLPHLRLGKASARKLDRQLSIYSSLPISMIITSPDFCLSVTNQFPKLKRLYFGGAILTVGEAKKIFNKFCSAEINYIYGATECNLITVTRLEDYILNLTQNGISVLGETVNGIQVRTNEKFEIMVSGKAMLGQYLTQSNTTNKEKDENGTLWHKTGDAGKMCNGKLIYFGRCDKKLPFDTHLYNSQLEQQICVRFPEIEKCAVCTKNTDPDKLWIFIVCPNTQNLDTEKLYFYVKKLIPTAETVIKKLKKMPCDVKHHTKINYTVLQRKIK